MSERSKHMLHSLHTMERVSAILCIGTLRSRVLVFKCRPVVAARVVSQEKCAI